jgi:CRP-like cAMP-binding protein
MLLEKDTIIDHIYRMPEQSRQILKAIFTERDFHKGHLVLKMGKIEKNLYFIRKGIVRAYSPVKENELTFWFGMEGEAVLSMKSYVEGERSYENIELLEDSHLYQIDTNELKRLYSLDIHIANWGRKLAEKELVKTEERLLSREFKSASERYQDLILRNPDLIRRVQLGHIASYLGITQVSLSRIRAGIR